LGRYTTGRYTGTTRDSKYDPKKKITMAEQEFIIGQQVVCIDNDRLVAGILTAGKIYKLYDVFSCYVTVKNDKGDKGAFVAKRFAASRKVKIKNLLKGL
jgi:hypothetical protein